MRRSNRRGVAEKACSKCKVVKPTTAEFYRPEHSNPELPRSQCKACEREAVKTYRLAHPKPKKRRGPLSVRFWRRVSKEGPIPAHAPELGPCWLWTGGKHHGYGVCYVGPEYGRFNDEAHRVAWFLEHGRWPYPCALHKCDGGNIGCVRPSHLYEGTKADNNRDKVERGRSASLRGAKHPNAKLQDWEAAALKAAALAGVPGPRLASIFGVSNVTVNRIKLGRAWQHLG